MSNTLAINCLVFGEDHTFLVKIARTESVYTLKDAIKEERKLAFQQVSIPVDGNLKLNVEKSNFNPDDKLSSTEELSDVFSEPLPRKHLHLVVERPTVGKCITPCSI
jgi:hypothetical protein